MVLGDGEGMLTSGSLEVEVVEEEPIYKKKSIVCSSTTSTSRLSEIYS